MSSRLCPLCGSPDHSSPLFSERGFDVVACRDCELLFISPYPSSQHDVHASVRENTYSELKVIDVGKQYEAERAFYRTQFASIAREYQDANAVLDVGCGTGRLLEILGEQYPAMTRVGIELNRARAEAAEQNAKCRVYQTPIERFASDVRFDVITLMNVLSHIPTFDGLFTSLRSLLAEGGRLVLKTGEVSSRVSKRDLPDWGIPGHMHFLGLRTIEQIARKYGFQIVRHQRTPLSTELFSRETWQTKGRSATRDLLKSIVLHTPFALRALETTHSALRGGRVYSSLIVLSPYP